MDSVCKTEYLIDCGSVKPKSDQIITATKADCVQVQGKLPDESYVSRTSD